MSNAKFIVANSWRPDLIAKYNVAKSVIQLGKTLDSVLTDYRRVNFYLNYFYEREPFKKGSQEFESSFFETLKSIEKNGFNHNSEKVLITDESIAVNAAHRLAICAALEIDIPISISETMDYYGFKYLQKKGLDQETLNYLALTNVQLDSEARVFLLHGRLNEESKKRLINKLGENLRVVHSSEIFLNLNGYVNLKLINYGNSLKASPLTWTGSPFSDWRGIKAHTLKSYGNGIVTTVVVKGEADEILRTKEILRKYVEEGQFSIHSSDTWQETIAILSSLYHRESLQALKSRPYSWFSKLDELYFELISGSSFDQANINEILLGGSAALDVHGIRAVNDIDFLIRPKGLDFGSLEVYLSSHDEYEYPVNSAEIMLDRFNHVYFRGIKLASLDVVSKLKKMNLDDKKNQNDLIKINLHKEKYSSQNKEVSYKKGLLDNIKQVTFDFLFWFAIKFKNFYRKLLSVYIYVIKIVDYLKFRFIKNK